MAKIVSSWNDWDPLKRVIVGRCDNSMIPPEEPATSEKVPVRIMALLLIVLRRCSGTRPSAPLTSVTIQ